ncbi:arginase [Leptolyngbya sp. 7M]|uniref:arginase n=1 Tax=Leptolyngbya sp. 7M TaxID=2812896 RepID=UPI001B8B66B3|nr:arginase [Leptolyngbya sp. 7M]QYO65599.1 arginase [Leptolyngbya sp. 7M]
MGFQEVPGTGKKVGIIGIPLGFGAGKQGSQLGVNAMRISRVREKTLIEHIADLGYEVADLGNVEISNPTYVADASDNPKYLAEMTASCNNIATVVKTTLENETIPIILGGDHSIAIGTFSGVSSFYHDRNEEVGLIWFDAHADINTPATSLTGNIHGMPLAILLGKGDSELTDIGGFSPKLNPRFLAHIGARDLDKGERRTVHEMGLRDQFFTMSDIDRRGMLACVEDAIAIASKAPGGFAVTFDVDMIDPRFAPGSGTLVRGGATYREAHLALEAIAEDERMRSFEIVEVNPLLDQSNITVELACELILSALGKTIL